MTTKPLRVEPVEVDYYQKDQSALAARLVRMVALVAIIYGAVQAVFAGIQVVGMEIGSRWYPPGFWYAIVGMAGGLLGSLLVLSAIACFKFKSIGRKGMVLYGILAVSLQMFTSGAYFVQSLRGGFGGTASASWPTMEIVMLCTNYVAWAVQSCAFPLLVILVFRMNEVIEAFRS